MYSWPHILRTTSLADTRRDAQISVRCGALATANKGWCHDRTRMSRMRAHARTRMRGNRWARNGWPHLTRSCNFALRRPLTAWRRQALSCDEHAAKLVRWWWLVRAEQHRTLWRQLQNARDECMSVPSKVPSAAIQVAVGLGACLGLMAPNWRLRSGL